MLKYMKNKFEIRKNNVNKFKIIQDTFNLSIKP